MQTSENCLQGRSGSSQHPTRDAAPVQETTHSTLNANTVPCPQVEPPSKPSPVGTFSTITSTLGAQHMDFIMCFNRPTTTLRDLRLTTILMGLVSQLYRWGNRGSGRSRTLCQLTPQVNMADWGLGARSPGQHACPRGTECVQCSAA